MIQRHLTQCCLCVLFTACAFRGLAGFPLVHVDPASTNAPSASRIVPVSSGIWEMRLPDGSTCRLAERNEGGVRRLRGSRSCPWEGLVRPNSILIASPVVGKDKAPRTVMKFIGGQLRYVSCDGRKFAYPAGLVKSAESLAACFPERPKVTLEKDSAADLWKGSRRLRLWYANPNVAGFLFVELILVMAALFCQCAKGMLRWVFCGLILAALTGLILTGSRSSLLLLALGMVVLLCFTRLRIFTWKNFWIFFGVILFMGLAAWFSGYLTRLTAGLVEYNRGDSRRVDIAMAMFRMMADAPLGWTGVGFACRTGCLNWYVQAHDHIIYTHLSRLVELGWFYGAGYIFLWSLAILASLRVALNRAFALPLALAVCFCLGEFLNSIDWYFSIWIIPLGAFALALAKSFPISRTHAFGLLALSLSAALVVQGAFIAIGTWLNAKSTVSIASSQGRTLINGEDPSIWIVGDETVLGGRGLPGREIMDYYRAHPESPALGYVHSVRHLPARVQTLVLPGRAAGRYLAALRKPDSGMAIPSKILFLSPNVEVSEMRRTLPASCEIAVIRGEYAAACDPTSDLPEWVVTLPGLDVYIPKWIQYVLAVI